MKNLNSKSDRGKRGESRTKEIKSAPYNPNAKPSTVYGCEVIIIP